MLIRLTTFEKGQSIMFFRILKKDLKRKKTMNIILLLFVILSSLFAAASMNNIAAVTGGIGHYFELSDMPDVIVNIPLDTDAAEKIKALPTVSETKTEHLICMVEIKKFTYNGTKMQNCINPPLVLSDKEMSINYFDDDNNVIEGVDKGWFYATYQFTSGLDKEVEVGDEFILDTGSTKLTLKYAGRVKGVTMSTDTNAAPYLLMNSADHEILKNDPELSRINKLLNVELMYVKTNDVQAIKDLEYERMSINTRNDMKSMFLYDMIAAYSLLMVSAVLMITAFIVLRFTIGFTISEEFREIGVMKAVGIGNGSIRFLYIIKYLAIAVIGSVIGFFGSIPLSDYMMRTVSKNIVLESGNNILIGLISAAAVVAIIMMFCYGSTGKIKKLSPIDAVRNGQTGERFKKKSVIHLGSSKLPATGFMAINDVLSAPRQFSIITVVFTLCILLTTLMSTFALTLKSEKLLWLFGTPSCDIHIMDTSYFGDYFVDFNQYKNVLEKTEKMLEENGIEGECSTTAGFGYEVSFGDKKATEICMVTKGCENDLLKCSEGYLPRKTDEIAMTGYAMEDIGAGIGDRVKIKIGDEMKEYIISGKFSTFMGNGHCCFMHPDVDLVSTDYFNGSGLQIRLTGDNDKAAVENAIRKIKKATGSENVYTTEEMIKNATGLSDTLNMIKKMMIVLTVIVTAMIVILMERSFISKEKSEIALMKAMGISDRSIIAQHTIRFVIVALLACGAASGVLLPVSNLMMNYICSMVGDVSGVKCDINAVEVFAVCPAIVLVITVVGAMLTALYTKTIQAADTASIE